MPSTTRRPVSRRLTDSTPSGSAASCVPRTTGALLPSTLSFSSMERLPPAPFFCTKKALPERILR